jgi:hypothetical protein
MLARIISAFRRCKFMEIERAHRRGEFICTALDVLKVALVLHYARQHREREKLAG